MEIIKTEKPFLSLGETAKLLSLSKLTVRRHVLNGHIRSFKVGGQHRISIHDLNAFLAKNSTAGIAGDMPVNVTEFLEKVA